ncbi:MAG: TIGR04141 family sporadically distributed protein [Candidatus Izemoplasmatales bacterium]|nr:TIGR04141 family sporadically distributed protein [Candidatus Izemoplasmatales bacterium]
MGINIYKILQKEELISDLSSQFYQSTNEVHEGSCVLKFFYKSSYVNEIKWRNVFDFFNVTIDFRTKDIKGLILACKNNIDYAITFGNSAFIAQRYCDVDFGFELARRIELKELKRKSTNAQRIRGRKAEVNTYVNEDNLDIDSGRIFTSLSFTPVDETLGKRIDFGKSIKFNLTLDINNIQPLLEKIESILENEGVKNRIPYLNKVKDTELINDYNSVLLSDLENKYSSSVSSSGLDFSLNEISIIGSSIYFEQESTMIIKYERTTKNINTLDLSEVFDFIHENTISLADFISKGRITYLNEGGRQLFSETIFNFISYDIPDKKVSLYEGAWNEYNDDFIHLIQDSIKKIEISHQAMFDNMNTLSVSSNGAYKEEKIINYLCSMISAVSIDKSMYRLPYESSTFKNKFQIELGDMFIDTIEYCSLKQGDNKSFNYCFDQSELAAEIMARPGYEHAAPEVISVWLFMPKLPINSRGELDITANNSIMLQRKIALWRSELMRLGFSHKIRINQL